MRRKALKLRQFPLGGAKINSTCIGTYFETYFAVGDSQNNIRLYTFEDDQAVEIYSNPTNSGVQTEVTAVAFSCTEKQIFSGTNRGIINCWDTQMAKPNAPLRGHSTAVNCFSIFLQQPTRIASGSYDTMIKLWDIRDKNCTNTLKGHSKPINSIAISPDGYMLLSGSEDNTARLWEMRMPDKPIYIATEHNGPIIKVKFNPEDCMFATCSMDRTAKYFRCEQKHFEFTSSTQLLATPVTSICFKQDGKQLFTCANDSLKRWNMNKNGLLLQSYDANWKGVQDISMIKGNLMGVAFSGGNLSLWACDVQRKIKNNSNNSQMEETSQLILPPIGKPSNRADLEKELNQLKNLVGKANQNVKNIQERPVRDIDKINEQLQKRRYQMQKKNEEQQRRQKQLQQERERAKQKLREEKIAKQKKQKERKQQQRLRKIQQNRLLQQKMFEERKERERIIQQKVKQTLEEKNSQGLQHTLQPDMMQNSSLLGLSSFEMDGQQKDKNEQFKLIGQLTKDTSRFQSVLNDRSLAIRAIIGFWKQGRINNALQVLCKSKDQPVILNCVNSILSYPKFKSAITPDVAISLSTCLRELFSTKHPNYLMGAFTNLNSIVLLFKDELIKIKTFSPMTRVDLSREERIAKCDKLIDQFLTVFKLQRLKKYYERKRAGQIDDLHQAAYDLYKNLQQVLIKIMPKKQPQLA